MAFEAEITSYSSQVWTRSDWGGLTQTGINQVTTEPINPLRSHGHAAFGLSTTVLSTIASGDSDLYVAYENADVGIKWGIKLTWPVEVVGIGDMPYYSHCWVKYGASPTWVDHKAHEITEISKDGIHLLMTPTSAPQSISVAVLIEDLPE